MGNLNLNHFGFNMAEAEAELEYWQITAQMYEQLI